MKEIEKEIKFLKSSSCWKKNQIQTLATFDVSSKVSELKRNLWVPRRPDRRGKFEVTVIDLKFFFRVRISNRLIGAYKKFNKREKRTLTEKDKEKQDLKTCLGEPGKQYYTLNRNFSNFWSEVLQHSWKRVNFFKTQHFYWASKAPNAETEEDLKQVN